MTQSREFAELAEASVQALQRLNEVHADRNRQHLALRASQAEVQRLQEENESLRALLQRILDEVEKKQAHSLRRRLGDLVDEHDPPAWTFSDSFGPPSHLAACMGARREA